MNIANEINNLKGLVAAAFKAGKTANERIDALPLPMVFKGTLGTGGTIESLPTASSSNEGFVYIVITDGTYAGQSAKAGDTFVSDGSSWVLVPSGDEPSVIDDSVRSTALTWSSDKLDTEFNGVKVKSLTYTGTGNATNTIKFPDTPKYIFSLQGSTSGATWFASNSIIFGVSTRFIASAMSTVGSQSAWYIKGVSFNGNDMIITSSSAGGSFNEEGYTYYVYYI